MNLTAHLVGTCTEAESLFERLQPTAVTPLKSGELAILAMHCNSENGLQHEPTCPARDPRSLELIHNFEPRTDILPPDPA
ncbi:MAG: hypothetical protein Q7S64_02475 [bacterium]|nr:hypothetical protein [bacterium]